MKYQHSKCQYLICFLGLMIFTMQIYYIANEKPLKAENLPEEICADSGMNITDLMITIFKCSLAFLFGGMISDMKFVKFGII